MPQREKAAKVHKGRKKKKAAASTIKGQVNRSYSGTVWLLVPGGKDVSFADRGNARLLCEGDEVEATIARSRRRWAEAHLKKVLSLGQATFPARLVRRKRSAWLVPLGRAMPERVECDGLDADLVDGQIVRARWQLQSGNKVVAAVEPLGMPNDPQLARLLATEVWDLPTEWPPEVKRISGTLGSREKAILADKKRRDLTKSGFITIDGKDTRDFDDAVFCQALSGGGGWQLQVAIADVSAYVAADSPLDIEAMRRGTSVYFHDHVVPMLPAELSENLCSLVQGKRRPVVVCSMRVDADGNIRRREFFRGLIRTAARLTYDQVDKALARPDCSLPKYSHLSAELRCLRDVTAALDKERQKRGALDMHTAVPAATSAAKNIIGREGALGPAHRLVENVMLAANVCAAEEAAARRANAPLRECLSPSAEKWQEMAVVMRAQGIDDIGDQPGRQAYLDLLERIGGHKNKNFLIGQVIRSMMQAEYVLGGKGHFPLALEKYTHFTSPIRRYPDVLVHRLLMEPKARPPTAGICKQLSELERRAESATRQEINHLRCLETLPLVGQWCVAQLVAVQPDQLVVLLEATEARAAMRLGRNTHHLHVDELRTRLEVKGRKGAVIPLGSRLEVMIERVVAEEQKIWLKDIRA